MKMQNRWSGRKGDIILEADGVYREKITGEFNGHKYIHMSRVSIKDWKELEEFK